MVVALYHTEKGVNPVTSTAPFCKSDSWENFLNLVIKLSSSFSAPYIIETSQSLHLLTNIFATLMLMATELK